MKETKVGFWNKYNKSYVSSKTAYDMKLELDNIKRQSLNLSQPKEWGNIRIINHYMIQVGSGKTSSIWHIDIKDYAITILTKPSGMIYAELTTLVMIQLIIAIIMFISGLTLPKIVLFIVIYLGCTKSWQYIRFTLPYKQLDKAIKNHLIYYK